ncbi:MAG: serine hydrolase domain-containing protein [Pseudomonadota bacterium]
MKFLRLAIASSFLTLAAGNTAATPPDPSNIPYGLWYWEDEVASNDVDLTIATADLGWKATVNGEEASVRVAGQTVTLEAPGGDRFTGSIAKDGSRITGYWVQPQTRTGFAEMATRVVLKKTGNGQWTTAFKEQARPFRVFLELFEDESGSPRALLRNPERNEIIRASGFDVEPLANGDLRLSSGSGDRLVAFEVARPSEDTLSVPIRRFDEPLAMRRASAEEAVAFYSRAPGNRPAQYQAPEQRDDGWEVASAKEAGFDLEMINTMIAQLANRDPRSPRPNLMHSMLVARSGKLVIEEYFHGYDGETPHDIRSVGKVFNPILIGALRHDGAEIALNDTPLPRVLASAGLEVDDPRKAKITLEQLLSFTSGLDCDVNRNSSAEEGNLWENGGPLGFWRFTASVPMVADPGALYAYCSASINMGGFVIREAAGKPILDVFHEQIAQPLQFGPYHWNRMPDGEAYLAGGAYILPRDQLKLAEIHASGGVWKSERILSRDWVENASRPRIAVTPETTGMPKTAFENAYFPSRQALGWREHDIVVGERSFRSFEITGNGGQYILVVPELELSVVFNGGNYYMGYIWGRWRDEYVGGYLIPALLKGQ